jgi:BirA family transcriptional regulator, biotin operon repressor / biotin---[acetyl-CoA-carboxylase] ligase
MPEPTSIDWGAEALRQQLDPLLPSIAVEIVARTASTNSALLARNPAGHRRDTGGETGADGGAATVRRSVESAAFGRRALDLQPCLLVAEQQTAGRGRQGRPWRSAPGASLTFSLALPLAAADWSGLSLAVGVALCETLDPDATAPVRRLGLKWPNDLWLMDVGARGASGDSSGSAFGTASSGRKLGGILIETVAAGARRLVVVGVGLNLRRFDVPDAGTGFAALEELAADAAAPAVLARVAAPLVRALQQFERAGFGAFAERFAARDLLRGRPVRTSLAEVPDGIARGVSPQGALLVQSGAGIASVASGEVSVRLAGAP